MNLPATLYLELGLALLMIASMLSAKPEYALFLYGLALGFPDVAVPLGTAINLRLDDTLVILFLLRSFVWRPAPLARGQLKVFRWQGILLLVCVLSVGAQIARGTPLADYETIKMLGCAAIVVALPRVLQSERRLRFLIVGLMCAGIALVVQIVQHLGTSAASDLLNFQGFKNAATFTTWNPNTIGQAATLLVFAAGLGWVVFPRPRLLRPVWALFAVGFVMLPASVFVRGTTLSIVIGFAIFLVLSRFWKSAIVFLLVCLGVSFYLVSAHRELIEEATDVNVSTGEGFSGRFSRWQMAIDAVEANPLIGQGFGQEWPYLSGAGSEGRAHNAYLSVWIELGLGGLLLLLAIVYQFISVATTLYWHGESRVFGALLLALVAAMVVDSFALPTLYWEKLPTIALSIGLATVGIYEREVLEAPSQVLNEAESAAFPQTT